MTGGVREVTSAILLSTDGRLLFQLRDDFPHIPDPGKVGVFGGHREGDETFWNAWSEKFMKSFAAICHPNALNQSGDISARTISCRTALFTARFSTFEMCQLMGSEPVPEI